MKEYLASPPVLLAKEMGAKSLLAADQHFGRDEEESSVVDSGDVEDAQDKHIPSF